ncbi:uncharacterized protein MJAP1_001243 [Malassezia japonica]|uniref:Integral membrane protein n=1 Tax=Malassezia japonica TaxID=223818 RepID=A0AAF0J939_9BASI|nr:uncharacterized protein MJAP1_001243 [Malassezia japonica]WFD38292.1 hypothetical protein MJAP1_001243 [Malassezia japonica]
MSEPSANPPPSLRIKRATGAAGAAGRARSSSMGERMTRSDSAPAGHRPRGKSLGEKDAVPPGAMARAKGWLTAPFESHDESIPRSERRMDLARLVPFTSRTEAVPALPKYLSGTDAPQSILYPPSPAMQPNPSTGTTQSAPGRTPHLTIQVPEVVRGLEPVPPSPAVPETQSAPQSRRGSIATTVIGAASSMNPLPRISSMWGGRNDETQSHSSHPSDHDHDEESSSRHWSSYVTPSLWRRGSGTDELRRDDERLHSDRMVDYLDVLDPAVGVFNTLQDFSNSVMLPHIPWIYDRRPTINIGRVVGDTAPDDPMSPLSPVGPDDPRFETRSAPPAPDEAEGGEAMRPSRSQHSAISMPAAPDTEQPTAAPHELKADAERLGPPASSETRTSSDDKVDAHIDSLDEYPDDDYDDPHTERWWSLDADERAELDHHIRHLLTNKSKTKRVIRGFWNFVRTPTGFILTTYGLLITGWGMLIMLLIIPWAHVGDKHTQRYWIEICDQVLCALFAAVGLGFAPFRAVDTYRMAYIAHYHFLTYKRRRLLHLPKLKNENELPRYSQGRIERMLASKDGTSAAPEEEEGGKAKELTEPTKHLAALGVKHATGGHAKEVYGVENFFGPLPGQPGAVRHAPDELQKERLKRSPSLDSLVDKDTGEVSVLTPTEQATLQHHQRLFHASHTFYRYCETATHCPFPLRLMMTIVILLDCHSVLQGTLGGITWGIYYERRPTALTATIITCSLSCNAMAGILIWQGGRRTRKTEVVERQVKLALEERAIERMERKRRKAALLEAQAQAQEHLQPGSPSRSRPSGSSLPSSPLQDHPLGETV